MRGAVVEGAGWREVLDARRAGVAAYRAGCRVLGEAREAVDRCVHAMRVVLDVPGAEGLRLSDALANARGDALGAFQRAQFDPVRLRRFGVPEGGVPAEPKLHRAFLTPLFELLRAWVRTGERRFADVYLDERLRFAPHQAAPEKRQAFFEEVLALEEDAIVGSVPPALRDALRRKLSELHAPLRRPLPAGALRLLALGDCLMNELRVALMSRARAGDVPLDFRGHYFSASAGGVSVDAPLALLRSFPAQIIAFSFLSYKGIAPYTALMQEADRLGPGELRDRVDLIATILRDVLSAVREHTDATFVVHNASGLPLSPARRVLPLVPPLSRGQVRALERLNDAVADIVEHTRGAVLLDEAGVARRIGHRACLERVVPAAVAGAADFHTARFGEYLAEPYLDVLRSYTELARCKVLAVDFDGTLWEGVMADGPVVQRPELQRLLRRLVEAGVLLVAVSKNDPRNIRWDEMVLRPADFVLHKISWDQKAASLQAAAEELGLGLDAVVLLDDNPVERDLVRSSLPSIRTLDPAAPHAATWLERMLSFPNTRPTEEARRRTELYRERAERKAALRPHLDYPTMMASLKLEARFGPARRADLARVAELVERTNQFNTTTLRFGRAELEAFLASPLHGLYTARLSDRFGDVGLVCVALVRRDGDARILELFVMSCRAMGFGLEELVLRRVLDAEGGPGVRFVGRYVPTERNAPCSRLFDDHGFERRSDTEWELGPEAPRPEIPAWFRS